MRHLWQEAGLGVRLAASVITILIGLAFVAPAIVPYDPVAQPDVIGLSKIPPSLHHPFGTDQFSRDLFSRTLVGARMSLVIALGATALAIFLGTAVGTVAGLASRRIDDVVMRIVDAATAIPRLVLLIVVLSLWGAVSPGALVVILGLTSWFQPSRIVRAEILHVRAQDFILASRGLGISHLRLACRHIIPHLTPQIVVATTLGIGNILLIEAGLSFLGLGVPAPAPSWGNIIRDGRDVLGSAPWVSIFPGLAIILTVVSFSLLGDHLQTMLNPRRRIPSIKQS